tara:strand:+ start:1094 stop:1264 length:171 start_codon:yes stop_codon:yes gene_type:complete
MRFFLIDFKAFFIIAFLLAKVGKVDEMDLVGKVVKGHFVGGCASSLPTIEVVSFGK